MDYSFMKTGFSPLAEKDSSEEVMNTIYNIIQIFTCNAFDHSSEYVRICNRNTITQEDMRYGLINELFEFIKRNCDDIQSIDALGNILKRETELYYQDTTEDYESDSDGDDSKTSTIKEDSFCRADRNSIKDNDDYFFAEKMHNYVDQFPGWEPRDGVEKILKDAIEKTLKEQ